MLATLRRLAHTIRHMNRVIEGEIIPCPSDCADDHGPWGHMQPWEAALLNAPQPTSAEPLVYFHGHEPATCIRCHRDTTVSETRRAVGACGSIHLRDCLPCPSPDRCGWPLDLASHTVTLD